MSDNMSLGRETLAIGLVLFVPNTDQTAAHNIAEFVRMAREELTVFGEDLDWCHWNWPGIGNFLKHGSPNKVKASTALHLHSAFVDFAKAYIRYQGGHKPGTKGIHSPRMAILRVLEKALLLRTSSANPVDIDLDVLDAAAQLLRDSYKPEARYTNGKALELLARFIAKMQLTNSDPSSWRSPFSNRSKSHLAIGKEADLLRDKKLPSEKVLNAIGELFARGFDLADPATYADVYTTSVVAMLMGASGRGGEIHQLCIDLEVEDTDSHGVLQYGWRYRAFKGGGWLIKWIHAGWVPIAKEAVRRVKAITEQPRNLARYIERQAAYIDDQTTPRRFYRHANCPEVADDYPLSWEQACAALGFVNKCSLLENGLTTTQDAYTLNSLWAWLLERLPPHFPYTSGSNKTRIKYSDALFCMYRHQLKRDVTTSPVQLWMPSLTTLSHHLSGSKTVASIFERHNYHGDDGHRLHLTSHQVRHLLDTLGHSGTGDTFLSSNQINSWAGRKAEWQGTVYNHVPVEVTVAQAADALKGNKGTYLETDLPSRPRAEEASSHAVHWAVRYAPSPRSCDEIEISYRGANHMTLYGCCEHDFLFEPCQKFGDCINCNEHHCVKGAGKDDHERLQRLRILLVQVLAEEAAAKVASERNDPGAQTWHHLHRAYRERIEQLVFILEDSKIPEGAIVRLANANAISHLHRVIRTVAVRALENDRAPRNVIESLLLALNENRPVLLGQDASRQLDILKD